MSVLLSGKPLFPAPRASWDEPALEGSLPVLMCDLTGCIGLQSGEAMSLECQCRGELALRHRSCAEKWSRVKVKALVASSWPQLLEAAAMCAEAA